MFLLKGHEDLRQDERVMQLFGLVNTLLLHDPDTFRRNLTIQVSTNCRVNGRVNGQMRPLGFSQLDFLLRDTL